MNLNINQATAEVFYTAFKALPKEAREELLNKILQDKDYYEDLIDIITFKQRESESSRPFEDYLKSRK